MNKKIKKFLFKCRTEKNNEKINNSVAHEKMVAVWRINNNEFKINKISDGISTLIVNGEKLSDPNRMANAFNRFFCNISKSFPRNGSIGEADKYLDVNLDSRFSFEMVDGERVSNVIKSLNKKAALSLNEIPGRIINRNPEFFGNFLATYINQSIETSSFPSSLKEAKIIPIYKKRISNGVGQL